MKKRINNEYQDIVAFYLMIAKLPEEKKKMIKEKIKESKSVEKPTKSTFTAK